MKEYGVTDGLDIRAAIAAGDKFKVRLPSPLAKLMPGVGATLTPQAVGLIALIVPLAIFGGLAAYAISKGYTVRRERKDGEKWEFAPP